MLSTCAQCADKMCLLEGRIARGEPFADYKELWETVRPILKKRAYACE